MNNNPFGNIELRSEICRYLAEWRGITAAPKQILITAGSGDALEICIGMLASPKDTIAFENPGYPFLYTFANSIGMKVSSMRVDNQGAVPPIFDGISQSPRLAVLTPSSQYPLGYAMPQARRSDFLSWAEETGSWVIEDDYDSEFRYSGRPYPALASTDTRQRVVYVGSFSKIFSNGLRMGFAVIPENLLSKMEITLQQTGSRASAMPQQPLANFMHSGEFYRHIRRIRRIYAERRRGLIKMLEKNLKGIASFDDHQTGMQIAIKLPNEFNDREISLAALKEGILCPALSDFYASGPTQNGLLLGFCGFTIEEMQDAMEVLAGIVKGRRKPAYDKQIQSQTIHPIC